MYLKTKFWDRWLKLQLSALNHWNIWGGGGGRGDNIIFYLLKKMVFVKDQEKLKIPTIAFYPNEQQKWFLTHTHLFLQSAPTFNVLQMFFSFVTYHCAYQKLLGLETLSTLCWLTDRLGLLFVYYPTCCPKGSLLELANLVFNIHAKVHKTGQLQTFQPPWEPWACHK